MSLFSSAEELLRKGGEPCPRVAEENGGVEIRNPWGGCHLLLGLFAREVDNERYEKQTNKKDLFGDGTVNLLEHFGYEASFL